MNQFLNKNIISLSKMLKLISFIAITSFLLSTKAETENPGLTTEKAKITPVGKWKQIDDETGKQKSVIRIEEKDGELFGHIEKIFPKEGADPNPVCDKCSGELKDKPILGMKLMWGLKAEDDEYTGGEIIDPKKGKTYKCKLKLSKDGKELTVRGFIGISLLGRSQKWFRED